MLDRDFITKIVAGIYFALIAAGSFIVIYMIGHHLLFEMTPPKEDVAVVDHVDFSVTRVNCSYDALDSLPKKPFYVKGDFMEYTASFPKMLNVISNIFSTHSHNLVEYHKDSNFLKESKHPNILSGFQSEDRNSRISFILIPYHVKGQTSIHIAIREQERNQQTNLKYSVPIINSDIISIPTKWNSQTQSIDFINIKVSNNESKED